jgi:hypothetical protein
VAGRGFLRVSGLIDPPGALLRPGLIVRILHRRVAARSGSHGLSSSAPGLDRSAP